MPFPPRLAHAGPCSSPTWQRIGLQSGLAVLFAVLLSTLFVLTDASAKLGLTAAAAEAQPSAQKYMGYWNYDQPNLATSNNVASMACPDGGGQCDPQLPLPLKIPQVGWLVFYPGPHGTVYGRSDQGCTWNFKVTHKSLELSSTTQTCFNHDIGSSYTATKWSVQVTGNKEYEQIVTVSHQPNGVDLIGTMNSGSRTRVHGVGGERSFSRFLGRYTYDPANFHTLTNVVINADKGTANPEQGTVRFTEKRYGTIVAHTPDGCNWTLAVKGNTAELAPATQTCHLPTSEISLRYWAIVTDGEHMDVFRAGSTKLNGQQPTNNYLYIGALTRSAPSVHK